MKKRKISNISPKKQEEMTKKSEKIFVDRKTKIYQFLKRYGIIILISFPIILVLNLVLNRYVKGYTGVVSFFGALAMFVFACFLGLVIFTKIDKKRENEEEDEHDPFSE